MVISILQMRRLRPKEARRPGPHRERPAKLEPEPDLLIPSPTALESPKPAKNAWAVGLSLFNELNVATIH